jgi:hypothetical protein
MTNSMTNIVDLEKGLFSNLQSEFYKFINILERNPDNLEAYPDALYLKKIIILNEQMKLLETMIYELKIDKIKNKNLKGDVKTSELLVDYDKDQKVLDYFKPFMLYYRFLIE